MSALRQDGLETDELVLMNGSNGVEPILEVKNLKTHFFTDKGVVQAVKGVSFELANGACKSRFV